MPQNPYSLEPMPLPGSEVLLSGPLPSWRLLGDCVLGLQESALRGTCDCWDSNTMTGRTNHPGYLKAGDREREWQPDRLVLSLPYGEAHTTVIC